MNHRRLARSLELLRRLNTARLKNDDRRALLELQLETHDADARAGLRPEQRTIFDEMERRRA